MTVTTLITYLRSNAQRPLCSRRRCLGALSSSKCYLGQSPSATPIDTSKYVTRKFFSATILIDHRAERPFTQPSTTTTYSSTTYVSSSQRRPLVFDGLSLGRVNSHQKWNNFPLFRTASTLLSRTTIKKRGIAWLIIHSPSNLNHATLLIPSSPFFKNMYRSLTMSEETMENS